MESNGRIEFDSSLGGKEDLPDEVNILRFAAARGKEIAAMSECILNPCHNRLIFQSIPTHMRRRVMSHNPRRLPRRLRNAHRHQSLKARGLQVKTTPDPRSRRRRPHSLYANFVQRQRKNRWLETHIWHAKRFHMTKRWGFSLAEAPCDKAFRACYRASSAHCLLQDISYYGCIQISGNLDDLAVGFKKITNSACGLSITAKAFLGGQREGSTFIFNINKYPHECIGKIIFFWRPPEVGNDRYLWIFAHASIYDQVMEVLKLCFQLKECNNPSFENDPAPQTILNPQNKKSSKNQRSNIVKIDEKYYSNDRNIVLMELKNALNRFRLTGPLSHAVLVDALKPAVNVKSDNNIQDWFINFAKDPGNKSNHMVQKSFWNKIESITSPAEIQSHIIIGLNVDDPRLHFPAKRTKATAKSKVAPKINDLIDIPTGLSSSCLWLANIRKLVSDKMIPNHVLNKRREKENLVPGEACNNFNDIQKIPVILIQRPGSKESSYKKLGYCCGWDIIFPAGYGMAFWLAFVMRGARTGGLREVTKLAFESGIHDIQPDTLAGKTESNRVETMLREKYFRLPPNKRVNFIKFSIKSPFSCPWSNLIEDWYENATNEHDYFVLRNIHALKKLQNMARTKKITSDIDWNQKCLIPVKVTTKGKGKITDFALICLPNVNDKLSNSSKNLVEPLVIDVNENNRKALRIAHKTMLKRLRRNAVRKRRKELEKSRKYIIFPKQNNTLLIENYLAKIKELWLPTQVQNIRHQCSRETIGFVTKGEFSFTEAKSAGIGYVPLNCLPHIFNNQEKQCLVLTRNTLSRQYRYASLEIICDT